MAQSNKLTTLTTDSGKWLTGVTINGAGDNVDVGTLSTAGTYVDKDIKVQVTVPEGGINLKSPTVEATIHDITVGTKNASSRYPITGSETITGNAEVEIINSGWLDEDTQTTSVSGTAYLSSSLSAAAATVTYGASATTPTVAIDASNDNILAAAATTTKPTEGYYAAVKATAPATTLSATTKTVDTKGYLGDASEITSSAATTATTGVDYYVPITAGSVSASSYNSTSQTNTDLSGYTEQTVTVPSQGSLILSEGYYPKTFITLDAMLDGKTDTAGTAAADIKNGFIAYDVDGKKLTGTMPQLTSSNFTRNATTLGGSTSATISGPTWNSTSSKFDVSSSGSSSATITTTASKEGWIAKDATAFSGTVESGTISGSKALDVIAGSVAISGTTKVTPTIGKATFAGTGTAVNAVGGGSVVTAAPSNGVYVAVQSAASSNDVSAAATISTAGYGTSDHHSISGSGAVAVGANASSVTYIPIATTSAAKKTAPVASAAGGNSLTLGTVATSAPASGFYIKVDATAGVTNVATAGWISAGDTSTDAAASQYYPVATSSHGMAANGDATVTAATLTNTQAASGILNSASITPVTYTSASSAGSNYIQVTATAKQNAAGSISIPVKCVSTAGYTTGETKTYSATGSVGVTQQTGNIFFKVYNGELVTA